MAGNSQRRGAIRKEGTKKGPQVGSGGQRRRGLEGKGATPRADQRPNHKAYKIAQKNARSNQGRHKKTDDVEVVVGRNPVLECLRAGVPATALYVVLGTESDERLTESVTRAADAGMAILEVQRHDLDRIIAHEHYLIPQWSASTHRMVYDAWRLAKPPVVPPYSPGEMWVIDTWWSKKP